jgi:hypothetical protein
MLSWRRHWIGTSGQAILISKVRDIYNGKKGRNQGSNRLGVIKKRLPLMVVIRVGSYRTSQDKKNRDGSGAIAQSDEKAAK